MPEITEKKVAKLAPTFEERFNSCQNVYRILPRYTGIAVNQRVGTRICRGRFRRKEMGTYRANSEWTGLSPAYEPAEGHITLEIYDPVDVDAFIKIARPIATEYERTTGNTIEFICPHYSVCKDRTMPLMRPPGC